MHLIDIGRESIHMRLCIYPTYPQQNHHPITYKNVLSIRVDKACWKWRPRKTFMLLYLLVLLDRLVVL